jgi:mycofactocin precursor
MDSRLTLTERRHDGWEAAEGDVDGAAEVAGDNDPGEQVAELLIEDISIDGMCGVY